MCKACEVSRTNKYVIKTVNNLIDIYDILESSEIAKADDWWKKLMQEKREWQKKAEEAKKKGKTKMKFISRLLPTTCDVCRANHNQVREIGKVPLSWYPPIHINCKCRLEFL